MAEVLLTQLELTRESASSKLKEEKILMSDVVRVEGEAPKLTEQESPVAEGESSGEKVTSKGAIQQTENQVITNSQLDNNTPAEIDKARKILSKEKASDEEIEELLGSHYERISGAQELLRELNADEKINLFEDAKKALGILRAHYEGYEEKGLDGNDAGVFNYTEAQLRRKVEDLKEAGFKEDQRRVLIESGIAAVNPPQPPQFNDPFIQSQFMLASEWAQQGYLNTILSEGIQTRVAEYVSQNAGDPAIRAEASALLGEVQVYMQQQAVRSASREDPVQAGAVEAYETDANIVVLKQEIDHLESLPQLNAQQQQDLENFRMQFSAQHYQKFKEVIRDFPLQTRYIQTEFVEKIAENDRTLSYLVNRIIARPMDSEVSGYQLGWIENMNLDLILAVLKARTESAVDSVRESAHVQYQTILTLKEASQIFHEMNRAFVTGNLEGAGLELAKALRPQQQELLQRVKGAGAVMRFLEDRYLFYNSRDKWIYDGDYDEMMGNKRDNDSGKIFSQQPHSILEEFRDYVIKMHDRQNPEFADMDDWEIVWGYNVGRLLYSVSSRPDEHISMGNLPSGEDSFRSFPRETAARIVNYFNLILRRFGVGSGIGGPRYLDIADEQMAILKRERGFEELKIKKLLGGKDISFVERAGYIGASGILSSWRELNIILKQIRLQQPRAIQIDGNQYHIASVGNIFERMGQIRSDVEALYKTNLLTRAMERLGRDSKDKNSGRDLVVETLAGRRQAEFLRQVFLVNPNDDNSELRPEFISGLGMIAKRLMPQHRNRDSEELTRAKNLIRMKVWQKAASENPLAVASYLHGVEYSDRAINVFGWKDEEGNIKLRKNPNQAATAMDPEPLTVQAGGADWDVFVRKISFLKSVQLQGMRAGHFETLSNLIQQEINAGGNLALTPQEFALYDSIIQNGRENAREFANVAYNFTPFLNDVPFEVVDYAKAGAEYYKRRFTGDWPGYNSASHSFNDLLNNPGGHTPEEHIDFLGKTAEGIAGPDGIEAAQDRIFPLYMATYKFFEKGGQSKFKIVKRIRQLGLVDGLYKGLQKTNSIAQQISGVQAASLDPQDLVDLAQKAQKRSVIDLFYFKKFLKRTGGIWRVILMSILSGISVGLPAVGLETGKQSVRVEGATA